MSAHGHLDCLAVMQAMYDYLDDELTSDRLVAMQGHLARCTGCRQHVEMARCFLRRLSCLPVDAQELSALRDKVCDALRREVPPA